MDCLSTTGTILVTLRVVANQMFDKLHSQKNESDFKYSYFDCFQVWYEWCITKPVPIHVHNPGGRSYTIGL